jgi:hypothetical protein
MTVAPKQFATSMMMDFAGELKASLAFQGPFPPRLRRLGDVRRMPVKSLLADERFHPASLDPGDDRRGRSFLPLLVAVQVP